MKRVKGDSKFDTVIIRREYEDRITPPHTTKAKMPTKYADPIFPNRLTEMRAVAEEREEQQESKLGTSRH